MIKIQEWTFVVVNNRLVMRNSSKGIECHFDPTEFMKLFDYLDEHRTGVQKALHSDQSEPTTDDRE